MRTHKDLDVWKKSIALVTKIYDITSAFPKDEMFGLTNQIRRCAVSIPSNIAEGSARSHQKEFIRFLHISLGSQQELETQFIIAKNLNYVTEAIFEETQAEIAIVGRMLSGLIKSVKLKMGDGISG
jgi:four helix bundle protein